MKYRDYVLDRQKDSHMALRRESPPYRRLVIPDHKEIAKGTLRAILRQAGISAEDLMRLL